MKCEVCQTPFEAQRSTARFCSNRCRTRAHRGNVSPGAPRGLVNEVRRELEAADRLDTVSGQVALLLAEQIVAPGTTGLPALVKELRVARVEALEGVTPSVADRVENELDRARRERDAILSRAREETG